MHLRRVLTLALSLSSFSPLLSWKSQKHSQSFKGSRQPLLARVKRLLRSPFLSRGLKFKYFAPQPPCENPHKIGLNMTNSSSLLRHGERMQCQDLGLETRFSLFTT